MYIDKPNSESALGGGNHARETFWIHDCQLGQHFPIDAYVGFFKATNQAAVADSIDPSGCINASNPETTKITFAPPPIAIGIAKSLHDPLIGCAEEASIAALKAAG
jgi:hypothetical protein